MASFTAVHRLLGRPPGPLTTEMIDEAITLGAAEANDLDFKQELPPTAKVTDTDFPKDIAAMANSGGGTILFGITETQKRATGRFDVDLDEGHERTLRRAAVSGIRPPVFDLDIIRVGDEGHRCVAVTVAPAQEPPHMIYKNDYFGAPRRNDADTEWMTEPQLAAMYRTRFDLRRDRLAQLEDLYAQTLRGRDTTQRVWFIAVAQPQYPLVRMTRSTRDEARACIEGAVEPALALAGSNRAIHPLEFVDRGNPRAGLRCWVARNPGHDPGLWNEAYVGVGDSGSVTLAATVGGRGRPGSQEYWAGARAHVSRIEGAVADFLGLLRATAQQLGTGEFDVQISIEWTADEPLEFAPPDPVLVGHTLNPDGSSPVQFTAVRASVRANAEDDEFWRQAHELALDCVNQGGITHTTTFTTS